jgi:hypothetical protein
LGRHLRAEGHRPAIIKKLNAELSAGMQNPDIRERLIQNGIEPAGGSVESFVRSSSRARTPGTDREERQHDAD